MSDSTTRARGGGTREELPNQNKIDADSRVQPPNQQEEEFNRGRGGPSRASSRASIQDLITFYDQERRQDCQPISRPTPSSPSSNSKPSRASSGHGLTSQGFISHQESSRQSSTGRGQAYRSERKSDGPEAPSRAGARSARSSTHRTSANQSSQSRSSHSSRSPRYQ